MATRPTQKYLGSCHCGAVRFEIETDFPELTRCDCSICRKKNALMVKVHESRFTLLAGAESLSEYQFHTKTARHYFCRTCGIYPFHRKRVTPDYFGINVFACMTSSRMVFRFARLLGQACCECGLDRIHIGRGILLAGTVGWGELANPNARSIRKRMNYYCARVGVRKLTPTYCLPCISGDFIFFGCEQLFKLSFLMRNISAISIFAFSLLLSLLAFASQDYDDSKAPMKLVDSHAIEDKFKEDVLRPLQLEGTKVRVAISRLVDIGFRCGILPGSYDARFKEIPWMATRLPYVRCERKLERDLTGYPTLSVSLQVITWKKHDESVTKLYEALESAAVEDAHSAIHVLPADDSGPVFSPSGVVELEKRYGALIPQSAVINDVARELVLNGFFCGGQRSQERNDFDGSQTENPALVCSILGGSTKCRMSFVSVEADTEAVETPSVVLSSGALKVLRTKWQCLSK